MKKLTEELERLLVFESFIRNAIAKEHKLVSVVFKYLEYLVENKFELTEYEKKYAHKRLNKLGYEHRIGFCNYKYEEMKNNSSNDKGIPLRVGLYALFRLSFRILSYSFRQNTTSL